MPQPLLHSLPETRHEPIRRKTNGSANATDISSGRLHHLELQDSTLFLDHCYHDGTPVFKAPFCIEFSDGTFLRGELGEDGKAKVLHIKGKPIRVQFGPDARPYHLPKPPENTAYRSNFAETDALALVQKAPERSESAKPAEKALLLRIGGWFWGTIQGNFNEQQTTSQVIVDAVISCIPLVGEATDIRDIIAITFSLVDDPKKRDDKWVWLELTVTLLALIPVVGGALKGVGKLLARAAKKGMVPTKAIAECIAFLNRMGWGKAQAWFIKLNLEAHTAGVVGHWRKICQRVNTGLASVQKTYRRLMPDDMLKRLEQLQQALDELKTKGESMIPFCVKELNRVLKEVQQQVYQGDWHEIPKTLKSKTREVEARLIDTPDGKKWVASEMHFPPSDPMKHYKRVEGWPDLKKGKHVVEKKGGKIFYKTIPTFSGPIRAVRLAPGTKIYRIIEHNRPSNGLFWALSLPPNGKVWREEYAVLESWSRNGYYVEFTVPEPGLYVWEGKVASQLDAVKNVTVKGKTRPNASEGQYLPGGSTQLVIDFEDPANLHANQAARSLTRHRTFWSKEDLHGLNVPDKTVDAQILPDPEKADKWPEWIYVKTHSAADMAVTGNQLQENLAP